jgi:hypothetical protein
MKRILVASILGIAACASTYGQGTIWFENYTYAGTQVKWGASAPAGETGLAVSESTVVVGLWANNASQSLAWTLLATTPIMTQSGGGWYQGGTPIIPTTLWNGTQTVTFQLRGSGSAGATAVDTANSISATWQESAAIVGFALPANEMANGPAALVVNLVSVPEPTTLTLAGLGAAALLAYRRRQ